MQAPTVQRWEMLNVYVWLFSAGPSESMPSLRVRAASSSDFIKPLNCFIPVSKILTAGSDKPVLSRNSRSLSALDLTITEQDVGNEQKGHSWPVNFSRHSIRSQTLNFRRGGRGRFEGISLAFLINPCRRFAASRYSRALFSSRSSSAFVFRFFRSLMFHSFLWV